MTKAESIAYLRKLQLKEKLSEEFLPTRSEGAEESFLEMESSPELTKQDRPDTIGS